MNLYHFVSQTLFYKVPGDFVELGCNTGYSSVLIEKIIAHFNPERVIHMYDSFEGLPGLSPANGDTVFYEGQLRTSKDVLISNFQKLGLPVPIIHEG